MHERRDSANSNKRLSGKWLVILIVGGAAIVAIISARFTKYRWMVPEPAATQP
ncbi:MAG TPA: hypothetical protein VFE47_20785 [Tepidisphaeraceae bacterium]|nr:hypothetical protein [Tepidisphaeraceae bacterium]